ncbi:MAG TPA: radical SAM protein [Gemmataceae bacterium]|jgi:radical SAM superfamily enzyme YgiQ (UPF0313 family)|nr:radical SAM protein [Gemmataceae bacterium]
MSVSAAGDHHVYLVQPKFPPSYWGLDYLVPLTPFKAIFPPLGLLTLAGLTPPEFRVTICDENAGERVDYETNAQIVGITGYIIQMPRVFAIADRFRALGKRVVLGGPLANLLPDLCREHCDVLFEGEAEYTWPRFLREFAAGTATEHYVEHEKIHLPDSPIPRLSMLRQPYAQGIVQCTRGCPFTCEFCDIIVMYGRKMRFKPVEQVLAEVEAWADKGATYLFFADDNFVGHRAYAKDLLRGLIRWNRKHGTPLSFHTQASIDMVRDEELLALLRDANFYSVFVGVESPRKASLAETHKSQNERIDMVAAIHKIHSYNLFVSAGMIVGFDQDDVDIFGEQYDFLQAANIPVAMLSVLLAVPKTPLYARLLAAGRIHNDSDSSRYVGTSGGTNFEPMNMTQDELRDGHEELYRRLYAPDAYAERVLGALERFHDVKYVPERFTVKRLMAGVRILGYYLRHGKEARRFFFRLLGRTARRSPRSLKVIMMKLGMYLHFCELHARKTGWDPWADPAGPPAPKKRLPVSASA